MYPIIYDIIYDIIYEINYYSNIIVFQVYKLIFNLKES